MLSEWAEYLLRLCTPTSSLALVGVTIGAGDVTAAVDEMEGNSDAG